MTTRSRQAADASNWLTWSKHHSGPPLSVVNGKPLQKNHYSNGKHHMTEDDNGRGSPSTRDSRGIIQQKNSSSSSSNSNKFQNRNTKGHRPEPGTDDEPLSSSEEEEQEHEQAKEEEGRGGEEEQEEEQEEKEEKDKQDEEASSPEDNHKKKSTTKRKRKGRDDRSNTKSQKSNPPSRTPPEDPVHSLFSNQRQKRRTMFGRAKSQSYGSSEHGFRHPAPGPDIQKSKLKSPDPFKVPPNFDIKSPDNAPSFRMPTASKELAFESMVSPFAHFREPAISASSSAPTAPDLEYDFSDDISSLSSPPSDLSLEELAGDELVTLQVNSNNAEITGEPRCPNCNAIVNADFLAEFLARPGRRLRDERLFCERHKADNAENEWTNKGYPTIDWSSFDDKIQKHLPHLERLLVPNPSSFFRGRLESTMKDSQAKVFKLSLEEDNMESLSCGYYGPKGASKMLAVVASKYSRRLRQLAAMDNLLKTAGPATYAQMVLVPELAVLLIKEDMNVDSQDARQIIRDSTDIGNRLNAAENDQIHLEEQDDDVN